MTHWAFDSVFYHIYPLGLCGAPPENDFSSQPAQRLEKLYGWIDPLQSMGVNAIYLGPVFESSRHGYDTADYFQVDRRLGSNQTLAQLINAFHQHGMRVILDGVLNHVGRNFWAFKDVLQRGQASPYCTWFAGLSFSNRSPYGDPFGYEGWNGHYDLVKLNIHLPEVKDHLFRAVALWVNDFGIDGLRLDAADCLELDFLKELAAFCRGLRSEFWLLGEMVHGDYRRLANPETLDSVTNYECYKGLYSSFNEHNFFEIAYALDRQFGMNGVYASLPLYNFVDNHDVNRVATTLKEPAHLYPLHCLLFCMPGIPSIYYGSEWGIPGERRRGSDRELRPDLDINFLRGPHPDLVKCITHLAKIRMDTSALRYGDYRQLHVGPQLFAFTRQTAQELAVVVINASDQVVPLTLELPGIDGRHLVDRLNQGEDFTIQAGKVNLPVIYPNWARILTLEYPALG